MWSLLRPFYPLLAVFLFLSAVGLIATQSAFAISEDEWKRIVTAAENEGTVKVHGPPGRRYEQFLVEGFRKAYPRISIEYTGSSGRVAAPRVVREYQAGIHSYDAYIAGTPNTLQMMKPQNILAPLRPILRPEITDDSKWFRGFEFGWMDKEKQFVYAFDASVNEPLSVNWDFVSRDALRTPEDLLKPEFAGKIVWDEPRQDGSGNNTASFLLLNYGPEFLKKLFETQKIVFTTNRRQHAEWVVRGRYPIGLGTGLDDITVFQEQGLGKNIKGFPEEPAKVELLSAGFGAVSLMRNAPNPNAAQVFINWLLSAEGQEAWNKAPRNSARLDVQPGSPELMPVKDHNYIHAMAEEHLWSRDESREIARKSIRGPMPKGDGH